MNGTDVMGSSLSSGRVRCMAFCSEDSLCSGDGEEEDSVDGSTKSLAQARDNLLQFVVAAILLSSIVVYLISSLLFAFHQGVMVGPTPQKIESVGDCADLIAHEFPSLSNLLLIFVLPLLEDTPTPIDK